MLNFIIKYHKIQDELIKESGLWSWTLVIQNESHVTFSLGEEMVKTATPRKSCGTKFKPRVTLNLNQEGKCVHIAGDIAVAM